MNLNYKKEDVLGVILLFSLVLILSSQFSSAQTSGCCISSAGDCTGSTSADCTSSGGTYVSSVCSSVPNCLPVCCEPGTGLWSMMTEEKCSISGGIRHPDLDSSSCGGCTSTEATVTGKVNYSDNTLASGSKVNVNLSSGAFLKSVNVNAEGSFSVCVPKNSNYILTFYNPIILTCNELKSIAISDVNSYDIGRVILPCTLFGGQCTTVWTVGSWSDSTNQCGTRTVTDTGNCVPATESNRPLSYIPCGTIESTNCGNGVLNSPDEECDGTNIPGGSSCSTGYVGSVTCLSNCKISRNCLSCSAPFSDTIMCACPAYANTQPYCTTGCSSSSIVTLTAKAVYTEGNKGIELNWTLPAQCSISSATIDRCDGNSFSNPTDCNKTSSGNIVGKVTKNVGSGNSYVDFDFAGSTTNSFCYNISVLISNGANGNFMLASTKVCTTLFDDACLNNPNEGYCVGKDLVTCQDGKLKSTLPCACGCVDKTASSPAGCVGDSGYCNVCDICSGPFGVFGYTPKSNGYSLSRLQGYTVYSTCDDILSSNGGFCYTDDYSRNKAVIGQYHSCFNVSSCYSYRTKDSCTSNPCEITALDNCEWISLSTNNELGLGLCIPEDPEEQDCTKCGELNILGKYCTPSMCSLFGIDESGESTCYYNRNINAAYQNLKIDSSSCMNIRDVACETYDSETECVGSTGGEDFSINTVYSTDILRSSGDNQNRTLSNDLFNRGKCIWNSALSKCQKNSDADPQLKSDCTSFSNLKLKENCFLDFTNPETKLFIMGKEAVSNEGYSANEFKTISFFTSEQVLNTYYSFSSAYPTLKYSSKPSTDLTNFNNAISALGEGTHTLRFYSEDLSHNLEVVKSYTFSIIPDLSGIRIAYNKVSAYDSSSDMFLTNLSINVGYDGYQNANLDCRVSLKNEASLSKTIAGDARKITPYLQWNYSYLPDGTYTLNVTCTDSHNQKYENSMIISIDADMSISNVYPKGITLREGNVNLRINTNESATCFYTSEGLISPSNTSTPSSIGSPWIRYSNTGGTNHSTTKLEPSNSGMRYYYSACYFASTGKWFVGNNGDIIFYAIDASAPSIYVYDEGTGELYNGRDIIQSLALRIVCDDSNSNLISGKNYAFGCGAGSINAHLYYEHYPGKSSVPLPGEQFTTSEGGEMYLNIFAPESYVQTKLDITVTDNGGNTAQQTILLSNLRNLSFERPIVTICNPETGICT
jgi:hypothetical protein